MENTVALLEKLKRSIFFKGPRKKNSKKIFAQRPKSASELTCKSQEPVPKSAFARYGASE